MPPRSSSPRRRSRFFGPASLIPIFLALIVSLIGFLPSTNETAFPPGSTLILTAHPDDETMFFAPAVQSLGKERDVRAVCMSTGEYARESNLWEKKKKKRRARAHHLRLSFFSLAGNAENLGSLREKELNNAYGILGVETSKLTVFDHPCVLFLSSARLVSSRVGLVAPN